MIELSIQLQKDGQDAGEVFGDYATWQEARMALLRISRSWETDGYTISGVMRDPLTFEEEHFTSLSLKTEMEAMQES